MPYCTLDEAWQQSLNPELQNEINNSLAYKNNSNYADLNTSTNTPKKITRVAKKSRTYNRKKNSNGKKTRLPEENTYILDNNNVYMDIEDSKNSTILSKINTDSEFNVDSFDPSNEYKIQSKDLQSNGSVIDEYYEENDDNVQDESTNKTEQFVGNYTNDSLQNLKDENAQLKEIIRQLKNNDSIKSDSFVELISFIASGIFIILAMENINNVVRRF